MIASGNQARRPSATHERVATRLIRVVRPTERVDPTTPSGPQRSREDEGSGGRRRPRVCPRGEINTRSTTGELKTPWEREAPGSRTPCRGFGVDSRAIACPAWGALTPAPPRFFADQPRSGRVLRGYARCRQLRNRIFIPLSDETPRIQADPCSTVHHSSQQSFIAFEIDPRIPTFQGSPKLGPIE